MTVLYPPPLTVHSLEQVVIFLVKELSSLLPMVALEGASLQLAVGRPLSLPGVGPEASSGLVEEPIAIYDLPSGRKKRVLHFRFPSHFCFLHLLRSDEAVREPWRGFETYHAIAGTLKLLRAARFLLRTSHSPI